MHRQVFLFRGGRAPQEVAVERRGSQYRITWGDRIEELEAASLSDGRLSLLFEDGRQLCGRALRGEAGTVAVITGGGLQRIALDEPLRDQLAHATEHAGGGEGEEEIRALMPGRVVEVCVKVGDRVEAGTLLLVLEAMKMQNEIRTARDGIVRRLNVSAGQAVEGGSVMLTIRSGSH